MLWSCCFWRKWPPHCLVTCFVFWSFFFFFFFPVWTVWTVSVQLARDASISVAESSHPSSTEHCFTNTIKDGMNGFLNKATQVDIIHTECFGFPTTGSQFTGWSPPSEDMADCMNSLLCIYWTVGVHPLVKYENPADNGQNVVAKYGTTILSDFSWLSLCSTTCVVQLSRDCVPRYVDWPACDSFLANCS